MSRTYATRNEAIEREILAPVREQLDVADVSEQFDVETVADRVLGDHADGYACRVEPLEFWKAVRDNMYVT